MQTRQLNTLKAGINATLAKLGDHQGRYFASMLPHAFDFYKEYVADSGRENRTVELAVLADRTAILPDDYDEYVMVGVRHGDKVRNLAYNGNLLALPDDAEVPQDDQPRVVLKHNYVGWCGGELEGEGYPGHGQEFRMDPKQRRIICSTQIPQDSTLILQYYSFSPLPSEEWVIDALWQAEYQLYLTWLFHEDTVPNPQRAERARARFKEAVGKRKDRTNHMMLTNVYAANARAARQFPK